MFFKKKEKPYYEEEVEIGSTDVDTSFKLKLSGFFKIMQEVIMHHTNKVGVGSLDLKDRELIWVITRVSLEIKRMPTFTEKVKVITYPGKTLKILYPRYIRMLDKDGNVLVNFSSIWTILDAKTRKPVLDCPIKGKLQEYTMDGELPLPSKITSPELSLIHKRKITYSDVDFNGHLNNTRYVEILQDVRTSKFYANNQIKKITINYLKELKEGEEVEVLSNSENPEYIEVKKGDDVCFLACVEY